MLIRLLCTLMKIAAAHYFAFAYNTSGPSFINSNDKVASNVADLTSEFTHNSGGSASSGTITFNGAVTLTGSSTMTGNTQFASTLAGGSNALTVTGDLDLDGTASGLTSTSVSGTSNLGASVTTSYHPNLYRCRSVLSADTTLTSPPDSDVSFGSTIKSSDSTDLPRSLSLATGSVVISRVTGAVGSSQ